MRFLRLSILMRILIDLFVRTIEMQMKQSILLQPSDIDGYRKQIAFSSTSVMSAFTIGRSRMV